MRRLAIVLVTAIGVHVAVAKAHAQGIVRFDASEPNESKNVQLRAELWRPAGPGPFPAVVLMHGCSGWQPAVKYSLRGYAEDLQKQGFVVLNLDSFGARYYNGEEMCASNAKLRRALEYRTSDAFDAARYLRAQPFVDGRNVFLMGQSNGGSVVMRAAQASTQETYRRKSGDPGFRGVVAFYPWCGLFNGSASFAAPVQVFAGGQDNWVSARECTDIRAQGARYDVVVYPQAAHSFDIDVIAHKYMGFLIGKDPDAAADSRQRLFAFLHGNLTDDRRASRQARR
jgi:dienelactone hydrolase